VIARWFAAALCCLACPAVVAQNVPADEMEALEPAFDTGAALEAVEPEAASSPGTGDAAADEARAGDSTAPPAGEATTGRADRGPARAGRQVFRETDQLELDATAVTGNQELPKVLYIVPWKKSDLGDLVGRPVNTLLEEALSPVDRDVFRRQLEYYESLYGEPSAER
jgi:hypothetical protein